MLLGLAVVLPWHDYVHVVLTFSKSMAGPYTHFTRHYTYRTAGLSHILPFGIILAVVYAYTHIRVLAISSEGGGHRIFVTPKIGGIKGW